MCGRYSLVEKKDKIEKRFEAPTPLLLTPRFNAAPTQQMPVVVVKNGSRRIVLMRWGLIPHWAKDEKIGYKMINARSETLSLKASFKQSLASSRCLVPASGFYEWMKHGKVKTPYYIRLKDQGLFAFAGLFASWINPQGNEVESYTIITTRPNSLLEPIHDRMPVMLRREDESAWLDGSISEPKKLLALLEPYPANQMEAYPVSKAVNTPAVDNKSLIEPAK